MCSSDLFGLAEADEARKRLQTARGLYLTAAERTVLEAAK